MKTRMRTKTRHDLRDMNDDLRGIREKERRKVEKNARNRRKQLINESYILIYELGFLKM